MRSASRNARVFLCVAFVALAGCSLRQQPTECSVDSDCLRFEATDGVFYACSTEGTCEVDPGVTCRDDDQCAEGEGCVSGACVGPDVEPDMGAGDVGAADVGAPDTGTPDLGAPDLGAPEDMGRDLGAEDMGAADSGAEDMGSESDMGPDLSGDPVKDRPLRVLFIGNNFTFSGPAPDLVSSLAEAAGWPTPDVRTEATDGGVSLADHRMSVDTLAAIDAGSWDVIVLQDNSTRATDDAGDPAQFKADATWLYDRALSTSPGVRLVLFETWARHPDHSFYPGTFDDAADMQAQVRFHTNDAVTYIEQNSVNAGPHDIVVAPVGSAWEEHLGQADAARLHGGDDWNANTTGAYLNALTLYGVIYNRATAGLPSLGRAAAPELQRDTDATTGLTIEGDPDGVALAPGASFAAGQTILIDVGIDSRPSAAPWNNLTEVERVLPNALDDQGAATWVGAALTQEFFTANDAGLGANTLGWPSSVSSDTLWIGSFDGHQAALALRAQFVITDLTPGAAYRVALFASRDTDDEGRGRLTRYTIAGDWRDLDASSNVSDTAEFASVVADADGQLTVDVQVSPDGTSRFAYVGAVELERLP